MAKKYFYLVSLLVISIAAMFITARHQKQENKLYDLLDRKDYTSSTSEWAFKRHYTSALREKIKRNPSDIKSMNALSGLFIQEARVSGNYMYYDKAALVLANRVLRLDSANFGAMTFKSLIYLSQHHFADGLAIAQQAQRINPFNAFIYGLLVDADVEMGFYDSAVANAERMVSIRPDLRSYSRVSYLREIYGDYPGAIEAMKMAVAAGGQGDEPTEWSRIQLARLYENTGDLDHAAMHYAIALNERPGYPYALAGLARIAMGEKRYDEAISDYLKADQSIQDYSIKEELIDAYKLAGRHACADSLSKLVIDALTKDEQGGTKDENIGHYADRELAYAYLRVNDFDKALEHALLELNRRPDNIDANETVAWAYYQKHHASAALPYLETALRTRSKNPVLLC
ncbi:MAG TPA: tetratricopeptide repeat protein, partial [Puia sp.]|nr:tetratricopeptide repeat protein [Puia sp.]